MCFMLSEIFLVSCQSKKVEKSFEVGPPALSLCYCLHMPKYPVCGYLLVSNQTVINSGLPGSAKLSLFISDFNMVFFTGGRKF